MQTAIISIIYHSRLGHTKQAAELLASFLHTRQVIVHIINVDDVKERWQELLDSDTLVFGCPTSFGSVSAGFKAFMEATETFLYKQLWRNKLAAAFTVSASAGGDKFLTLQSLAAFAAQHSMLWISLGVLPRYCSHRQTDGQNRFASYLGLMIQSDNRDEKVEPFHSGDIVSTELFANRILGVTLSIKNIKTDNHETIRN
jgi:multimeric flavodoxin WrbA